MEEVVPKSDRSVLEGFARQERNQRLQVESAFFIRIIFCDGNFLGGRDVCFFLFKPSKLKKKQQIKEV